MKHMLGALIAASLVLAGKAIAAEPPREVFSSATGFVIGPIAFDASLADIRAAVPEAAWEDASISPFSGRIFGARAKGAVELGGLAFDVVVEHRYYDRLLTLWRGHVVESAADCDAAVFDWLAAIEPGVGPLSGGEPRRTEPTGGGLYWSTTRQPNGGVIVTPSPRVGSPGKAIDEIVAFGEGSTANLYAIDEDDRPVRRLKLGKAKTAYYSVKAAGGRERATITATASYFGSLGQCEMILEARAWTPRPDPAYLSFDATKIVSGPTIAERHFILSLVEGGLAAPADYTFDCLLSRITASAVACSKKTVPAGAEQGADYAYKSARLLAEGYQFDLAGVDRDDPAPLRMIAPVRLDPADIVALDFAGRARTPVSALRFVKKPDADDLARASSHIFGGDGVARTIALVCQAAADGSVVCVAAEGAASEAAYERAAREASLAYHLAPKLATGAPSAGAVFDIAINLPAVE